MSDFESYLLAELHLKRDDDPSVERTCFCTRVFIPRYNDAPEFVKESSADLSPSDEDVLIEDELSSECNSLPQILKNKNKQDFEHETVSCYCSASHTDNLSTDEHDSLKDSHDVTTTVTHPFRSVAPKLQPSDSGADLSEFVRHDIDSDWTKFWSHNGESLIWESWIAKYSAYINPTYLPGEEQPQQQQQQQLPVPVPISLPIIASKRPNSRFSFNKKDLLTLEVTEHPLGGQSPVFCALEGGRSPLLPKKEVEKNRVLVRNLSGSDEDKINGEVSEGWNPLSPASIDCETEIEQLLSSRCGSHASSSLRTVDSMTNVTRMTISSLDLSESSHSSDSFSSVSSVHSSMSSEPNSDNVEDYQQQWNILWKDHYKEEYEYQYSLFVAAWKDSNFPEPAPDSESKDASSFGSQQPSKLTKKNLHKIFQGRVDNDDIPNPVLVTRAVSHSLGQLLIRSLRMSSEEDNKSTRSEDRQSGGRNRLADSDDDDGDDGKIDGKKTKHNLQDDDDYGREMEGDCESMEEEDDNSEEKQQMALMGLPVSFGGTTGQKSRSKGFKRKKSGYSKEYSEKTTFTEVNNTKLKVILEKMGLRCDDAEWHGKASYDSRLLRASDRENKKPPLLARQQPQVIRQHIYFDDDGMPIKEPEEEELSWRHPKRDTEELVKDLDPDTDSSESDVKGDAEPQQNNKRPRKANSPTLNATMKKYWNKRYSYFSRFDEGIKLDLESWYSVTPENLARHHAKRMTCDVIIDGFCGAGGNSIQFAMTCKKVIAIDIDPAKIELAKHNAAIYGVDHKIDFLVGDFLELAPTLSADMVFMSPPWGGPNYNKEVVFDLETMLLPVPIHELLAVARKITAKVAAFLPKNSNTHVLFGEAAPSVPVEIEQDYVGKSLTAITVYFGDLAKKPVTDYHARSY